MRENWLQNEGLEVPRAPLRRPKGAPKAFNGAQRAPTERPRVSKEPLLGESDTTAAQKGPKRKKTLARNV